MLTFLQRLYFKMKCEGLSNSEKAFECLIKNGFSGVSNEHLINVKDSTKEHIDLIQSLKLDKHTGAALFLTGSSNWGIFNSITPESDLDLLFVLPSFVKIYEMKKYLPLEISRQLYNHKLMEKENYDGELVKILSNKVSLTVMTFDSFVSSLLLDQFLMKILMPDSFALTERKKTEKVGAVKALGVYVLENNRYFLNIKFQKKVFKENQFLEAWHVLFLPTFFYFGEMDSVIEKAINVFCIGIEAYDWNKVLPFHPRFERLPMWIKKNWSQYLKISPIKIRE